MVCRVELKLMLMVAGLTSLASADLPGRITSENKTLAGTQSCWLAAPDEYRQQVARSLLDRVKLLETTIHLSGHPKDMLDHVLSDVFRPYVWTRSTSRQGRSLLMLDANYRYKSLTTLSIGVASLNVNLTDTPARCIRGKNREDTLTIIRMSFLRDFIVPEPTLNDEKGSFGLEDHICNTQVLTNGAYAEFRYRCCQDGFHGALECYDLHEDDWVSFLLSLIIIIKILVVLYSPLFLPDSLYRLKYSAGQYIHHVQGPALTVKVVVTQYPSKFGVANRDKTVRLSDLHNMEYFKTMVSNSSWIQDTIYQIKVQEMRLSVKERRLLDSQSAPVKLTALLYNYFLRCHLSRLEPLRDCCGADILGKLNPGIEVVTWRRCLKILAQLCLVALLATPWVIQVIIYFQFEADLVESKRKAAQTRGLEIKLPPSVVLQMMPLNILFIIVCVIFVVDSIIYGAVSASMKEKLKFVTRQCLRDMRERSRIAVLAWATRLTVLPFKVFGVVGVVLFVPYLAVLAVVAVPVIAFYVCPTLNLSVRLLIHLFLSTCPRRAMVKLEDFSHKLAPVRQHFNFHEVTANEKFAKRHHYNNRGWAIQLLVIIMCLVSFWSITLLLMEIISFFVEMFVYTFMGLVVNAGVTLQYVTVLLLVIMYSRNTFSRVYGLYQSYHKVIHRQLMAKVKAELDLVSKQETPEQENTAFIVHGDTTSDKPAGSCPHIRVKNHKAQWFTSGVLVFLDSCDTPLTPVKFFNETVDLKFFGCPGPVYRNVRSAVWEFMKIVFFLLFVFVVVMALGDAYQISTTNQLLATVVGGFLPFIFRNIFTPSTAVDHIDTSSIQFKAELHKAIVNFQQSWPVFDIIPASVEESRNRQKPAQASSQPKGTSASVSSSSDGSLEQDVVDDTDGAVMAHNESSLLVSAGLHEELDIIVDVSSEGTGNIGGPRDKDLETGSVSMLGGDRQPR